MGNPGLGSERVNNVENYAPISALTAIGALMTVIDFTLSNARRFYLSMGNPLAVKGLLTTSKTMSPLINALTAVGALNPMFDMPWQWKGEQRRKLCPH